MVKTFKSILLSIIPQQQQSKFDIYVHWDTIIGAMKDKVRIEKVENDILYLSTTHPAWAQEIMFFAPILKERITSLCPNTSIKTIRISPRRSSTFKQRTNTRTIQQSDPSIALNAQEKALLATLPSNELQLAIAAYFIRCKSIKRSIHGK